MGQRQTMLAEIVGGYWQTQLHAKPTRSDILASKYSDNIFQTYSALGGQLSEPPTKFGGWDVSTNSFIIELDEERHFNRYRLTTLQSPFYKTHKYFSNEDYQQYCKHKESLCLQAACWGKNWKNNSTEKQFSRSNIEGVLTGSGSSRWKQRAYYDFLKDIASKIIGVPILRLSIYDTYNGTNIDQLFKSGKASVLLDVVINKLKKVL